MVTVQVLALKVAVGTLNTDPCETCELQNRPGTIGSALAWMFQLVDFIILASAPWPAHGGICRRTQGRTVELSQARSDRRSEEAVSLIVRAWRTEPATLSTKGSCLRAPA